MAIESPCVKRCELDPQQRHCLGCGRSLEEIGRWSAYTPGERRRIMAALPARLVSIQEQNTAEGRP